MAATRISRRLMLGTVGAASLAPAFPRVSGAPPAGPGSGEDPPVLRPVFAGRLVVGPPRGTAAHRQVSIIGGRLQGAGFAGEVQRGCIDWHLQATGGTEVIASFAVRRDDGSLVEVRERGLTPETAEAVRAVVSTSTEILGDGMLAPASMALMIGRLDATGIADGVVHLAAFEVA